MQFCKIIIENLKEKKLEQQFCSNCFSIFFYVAGNALNTLLTAFLNIIYADF